MSARLNPYINLSGEAAEALAFYADVFGGEPVITRFGDFGGFGIEGPEAELVMHGHLSTPAGFDLMVSDLPESMRESMGMPPAGPVSSNISVCLSGDDTALLHGYWDKLVVSSTVVTPLAQQVWGDEYGQCVDRFGTEWMFNIAVPQDS